MITKQLLENASQFQSTACRVLEEMFGLEKIGLSEPAETPTVLTEKNFIVSIYYTGTVYGEYQLAMEESTAAKILGISESIDASNRESIREQISDAFAEILNMIVGECLVQLQSTYAKLTLTPPRIFFGKIRYPKFRTAKSVASTTHGEVECHFCLDLMRLDLATSYNDALNSLLEVNSKLKQANEHLAEQQAQLVHSEKMASVGMLASGIAHEINNPLFFVESNLTTLTDYVGIIESMIDLYKTIYAKLESKAPNLVKTIAEARSHSEEEEIEFVLQDTQNLVEETRDGVRRIKTIVKGLKDFAQNDVGGVVDTDLNLIVHSTVSLLGQEFREHCEFKLCMQEVPRVVCNAAEIGQVLLHIVLNAAQSVREKADSCNELGAVTVSSYATENDAVITIEDTGVGIPSSIMGRIFDPFFTTKEEGEGVGLGLSIAYGIIRKHNGSITAESEVGLGTKFTLRLPLLQQEPNAVLAIESS